MRKLFFISLAIITLSINAVAQNQRLTDVKMINSLNSFKNLHIKSNEGRCKVQAKNLEINLSQKIQIAVKILITTKYTMHMKPMKPMKY